MLQVYFLATMGALKGLLVPQSLPFCLGQESVFGPLLVQLLEPCNPAWQAHPVDQVIHATYTTWLLFRPRLAHTTGIPGKLGRMVRY